MSDDVLCILIKKIGCSIKYKSCKYWDVFLTNFQKVHQWGLVFRSRTAFLCSAKEDVYYLVSTYGFFFLSSDMFSNLDTKMAVCMHYGCNQVGIQIWTVDNSLFRNHTRKFQNQYVHQDLAGWNARFLLYHEVNGSQMLSGD